MQWLNKFDDAIENVLKPRTLSMEEGFEGQAAVVPSESGMMASMPPGDASNKEPINPSLRVNLSDHPSPSTEERADALMTPESRHSSESQSVVPPSLASAPKPSPLPPRSLPGSIKRRQHASRNPSRSKISEQSPRAHHRSTPGRLKRSPITPLPPSPPEQQAHNSDADNDQNGKREEHSESSKRSLSTSSLDEPLRRRSVVVGLPPRDRNDVQAGNTPSSIFGRNPSVTGSNDATHRSDGAAHMPPAMSANQQVQTPRNMESSPRDPDALESHESFAEALTLGRNEPLSGPWETSPPRNRAIEGAQAEARSSPSKSTAGGHGEIAARQTRARVTTPETPRRCTAVVAPKLDDQDAVEDDESVMQNVDLDESSPRMPASTHSKQPIGDNGEESDAASNVASGHINEYDPSVRDEDDSDQASSSDDAGSNPSQAVEPLNGKLPMPEDRLEPKDGVPRGERSSSWFWRSSEPHSVQSERPTAASTTATHRTYQRGGSIRSSRSLPKQVEFRSEFDAGEVLLPNWSTRRQDSLHPNRNCYGVVHVRPLRAQRLSCSVGTSVQAIVSLRPWEGKIRTASSPAFSEQARHGVCVRWGEEAQAVSMVHAYSGEETPFPTIQVDLVFKLVFEFTVCSFEVSCEELMAVPHCARRQWFAATDGVKHKSPAETPLLELEAVFEPADTSSSLNPLDGEGAPAIVVSEGHLPIDLIEVGSITSSLNEELVTLPTPSFRASHRSFSRLDCNEAEVASNRDDRDTISLSQHSNVFGEGKTIPATPHMLRVTSHWTPATCCVCKRNIMSGITRSRAFHCEVCKVDCCNDCRLQVDVQLPCGSETAERARSDAIQNRLTMENIINTVAPPVAVNGEGKPSLDDLDASSRHLARTSDSIPPRNALPNSQDPIGVGTIAFDFIRAVIFDKPLPPDVDPESLKEEVRVKKGDYYIRVTSSSEGESKRTRTMQNTGRLKFDSGELKFNIPHYAAEFRIELVDASRNSSIGAGIMTAQTLLLRQRDSFIKKHGLPVLAAFRGPPSLEAQHFSLELRSGIKSGADFYSSPRTHSSSASDKPRSGDIVGTLELNARVSEDFASLFGQRPYECPPAPPVDLNMTVFGVHLTRLFTLFDDIRGLLEFYGYVVSWKNPVVTFASLVVFVYSSYHFDAEYVGSIPAALLLFWMMYQAVSRWRGGLRKRLLNREEQMHRKSMKVKLDHGVHRPAGRVTVAVDSGKNLRSADLGLPGLVGVRVFWDPLRYLDAKRKESMAAIDTTTAAMHEIGSTNYQYSTNPAWGAFSSSETAKRLTHLLPSSKDGDFFGGAETRQEVDVGFPILQPMSLSREGGIATLESWGGSLGAIVFEVRFQDTITLLPGSEYSLGEVAIPFAKLTQHQEISGWFQVLEVGSTRLMTLGSNGTESSDVPQIHVRVAWAAPSSPSDAPTDTEREASFVIQEELVRSALATKDKKLGLVGSSIGAFNTVRGLSDYLLLVQNTLGSVLDVIGSVRNAFNFSDPYKSSILFWVVFFLWALLAVIPTRVLVLAAGLGQYIATFITKYGHLMKRRSESSSGRSRGDKRHDQVIQPSPVSVWLMNAFRGIPTDEDVRKTYFWECRRHGITMSAELAESKRKARLQRLWRAQFYSPVILLQLKEDGRSEARIAVFSMVQGHRFLWWRSVEGFDSGEKPEGLIFLSGHAGLATPSPLELRLIGKDEMTRVVSIFGRGRDIQERITIIAPSDDVRMQLEHAVSFATSEKWD